MEDVQLTNYSVFKLITQVQGNLSVFEHRVTRQNKSCSTFMLHTHICKYIHLKWDKLKNKVKVEQNNMYSYCSDVGCSDGDRD